MPAAPAPPDFRAWTTLPAPALRPFVRAYVEQALDVAPGREVRLTQSATVEPVACVAWAGQVHVGACGTEAAPVGRASTTCRFVGPMAGTLTTRFAGSARGFFVRFAPTGVRALWHVRGADYRAVPPFERVAPDVPGAIAWAEAIAAAPDATARAALTDAWLLATLASSPPADDGLAFARAAVETAEHHAGNVRIAALAAALDVSTSTLRRRFGAELGIGPKLFCEIVRFRRTHAFLRAHPRATWADAALEFGYTDQAHLGNTYTRFAGVSPTRWATDAREMDLAFGMDADDA